MLGLESFEDRLRYRTHMPPVGTVAYDKVVAIGNATAQIKNHEFFSLLGVSELSNEVSEVQRVANGNLLVLGGESKQIDP